MSPDGKFMVSGSDDETIRVWDLRTGKILTTKSDPVGAIVDVHFHPCEMLFSAASSDQGLALGWVFFSVNRPKPKTPGRKF